MEEEKGRVCVTGGSGYIASWLVMRLLQLGYSVHATVRSPPAGCKTDMRYITELPGASNKLKLFNADLNEPDSFNAAIEGCMGVFHVAHPTEQSEEPEETVTKRAVGGLLGILKACLNSKTVRRIVYTSSLATVAFNNGCMSREEGSVLDENMWSDIEMCKSIKNLSTSYLVSKTVTERTALEFAEKNGLDLVSLVLPLVVGPFICPSIPSSVYIFLNMILGKQDDYKCLVSSYTMVHVDDVASAQIFLLEHPNSKGRYICSSVDVSIHEMFEYFSARYPEFELPLPERLKKIRAHKGPIISSKKLLDCGFNFKCGLDEMFDGAIRSCKGKGLPM